MQSLAPHDRPRERLERLGPTALGDQELLALLLGHGCRAASALDVAGRILSAAGGVRGLTRLPHDALRRVRGVGTAKAARILAAVELGRRALTRGYGERTRLMSPRETAEFLMPQYGARPVEQFGAVLLDVKCRVLRTVLLSVGALDASIVQPREVFREATTAGAAAVIVFHNHPSGDPHPSPEDIALTSRLIRAGHLLGIEVVDHLILGDGSYYSFKEAGQV
jgi:DNA repair protein RadC